MHLNKNIIWHASFNSSRTQYIFFILFSQYTNYEHRWIKTMALHTRNIIIYFIVYHENAYQNWIWYTLQESLDLYGLKSAHNSVYISFLFGTRPLFLKVNVPYLQYGNYSKVTTQCVLAFHRNVFNGCMPRRENEKTKTKHSSIKKMGYYVSPLSFDIKHFLGTQDLIARSIPERLTIPSVCTMISIRNNWVTHSCL